MVKTLGIKFQVAGVKEAQAALNSYKNSLESSLQQNKQAVQQSLEQAKRIPRNKNANQVRTASYTQQLNRLPLASRVPSAPQRGEVLYDYFDNYQRTLAAFKNQQYRQAADTFLRPRANAVIGGMFDGIGSSAGSRIFNKLDDFGRKLIGKKEYRETINLSDETIDKLRGVSIDRSAPSSPLYKKQSQRDINAGVKPKVESGLLGAIFDQIKIPIKTLQYSFYEGIGSNFGNRFAEGLNKAFNEDLDLSFERKGEVSGKAISYTATSGSEQFKQDANKVSDNYNNLRYAMQDGKTGEIAQKFDSLFKSIIKSVTGIGDSYVRGFRKSSVQLEALRKIEEQIKKQENSAPDLAGKKKVIYTVGGFAGAGGQKGKGIAESIKPLVNDETEVIGAENTFTDVKTSAEVNAALWGVNSLANVAKINLKGFNPDAVKLAAQVINTLAKNPDVVVDLVGHSAGGFVVEEAQEILNLLGKGDRVKSKTVGTPNVKGGIQADGVTRIMGDGDAFVGVEKAGEYLGVSSPTEKIVKGVKAHQFADYLNSDDFLDEVLGDSLDKDKLKNQKKKRSPFKGKLIELETLYTRYVSSIYQELDDLGEELSIAPDRLVAKNRREKLRDRGGYEVQRKLRDKDFKPIDVKEGTETAVLISGGFAGVEGRSGALLAKELNKLVDDDGKTQYKGLRNPFTDVFKRDEDLSDQQSLEKVLNLFKNVHELGYNPDSAEIAAQVIDLLAKDPKLKVKIGGYSGGGYPMEDVVELLKSQGVDMSRVEVMGIATPDLPGGIKNREFKKVLGANDNVFKVSELKKLNNQVKEIIGFDIFPELMAKLQNIPKIDDHSLDAYIEQSKEVQDFFYGNIPDVAELLKNRSEIEDLLDNADYLGGTIDDISQDESLDPAKKIARLQEIRSDFIRVLNDIYHLAKYSESIKGGRYFREQREKAAENLEEAGIIVEPVKVKSSPEDPWQDTPKVEQNAVANRSKALAQEYKQYLQLLSQKTKSDRSVTSQVLARDFAASDPNRQKELLAFIKQDFNAKAKAYRAAVKSGQLELAKEQGEALIKQAASVKSLYGELAKFDQLEPFVQAQFQGYNKYVSSVENEVLAGTGRKGGASQGLPDLFEGQLNLSEDDGENVAEGFINGILKNLMDAREAGEQLIDAVEKGIRDAGEIQSPSKLAQRLGRWFAQGFGLGMSAENLEAGGREVVAQAETGIIGQVKGAFGQLGTTFPWLVKYKNLLMGIAGLFLGGMGISFIISQLGRFGKQALDTAMAVESLNKSIIVSSRDFKSGADNLDFISDAAKNMSIDLMAAKQAYAGLIGAAKDTPLEGQQTERIFNAFAQASANRGVNAEGQDRLFTALSQIIGKRKLQAEEVKGQIGDIKGFGDFQNLIAQALGVSTPELGKMMEQGQVGIDVLPKIAAILEAQNGAASGTQTALQAQTKYNNSLTEFNTVLGNLLQPLQKLGFNLMSGGLDLIAQKLGSITKIVVNLAGVALVALFGQVNVWKLAVAGLGQGLNALIVIFSKLWAAKAAILVQSLKFIAAYALVAGAIKAVTNVIDLSKNQYQELNDDVEKLTASMGRYTAAIKSANTEQAKVEAPSGLELNEGWKLPDNKFGNLLRPLVGGDRLNLDNLVRNRWNGMLDRMDAYNSAVSGGTAKPIKGRLLTEAERRQADFQVATGDLNFRTDQLLMNSTPATDAATQITEFDAQIAEIQSKRLELLPSDKKALEASLEEERKINTERDKQLKILTEYQQSLQLATTTNQKALEELETGYANGEFDESVYESQKAALLDSQSATADKLEVINNILSEVSTRLSEFQRRLQKSDQRVEGFFAQYDRQLQEQKAGIIEQGIADGTGTQVIQLELDELQQQDLKRRIDLVKKELAAVEKDLRSPELDAASKRIKENLAKDNIPLNESSLNDIIEKTTVQADREAAQGLLRQLRRETQLSGLSEQLAQNLQQNRNALIDFNRTIQDYFFRITQQIKEATLEGQKLLSQILYGDFKNKLRSAIAPGSNTFVNGIIENVQGFIDQAQQVAEKIFGDQAAQLGFESEQRTLAMEMQDFVKQVQGAGEALDEFAKKLKDDSSNSSSGSNSVDTLTALRRAIIGKESGTNFKAVNPHSGALGYGQVMPANVKSWTKEALGRSLTPEQFLNDSLAQVEVINFKLNQYLQKELSEGYDLDTAVRRVASTWYNGQPGKYNNTKAQSYAGGKYPSIDSYTKDILSRFKSEGGGVLENNKSGLSKEGSTIAKNALNYEGKHFKKGVYAMCAGFVRQVLEESGVNLGVTNDPYDAGKQSNNGELMARSFFGSDIGTIFKDKNQAKAGDLVGFFDTYQYGQKPGAITHVGVYTGDGMMVDRSTSDAPVRHRSIDTFKGEKIFLRPHAYTSATAGDKNIETKTVIVNEQLVAAKAQNLEYTKKLTEQEREALEINAKNAIELNKRQTKQALQENARNVLGLEGKFADFKTNYGYQSAQTEIETNLRNIKQQFLDADLDIANQIINTEDAITSITNSIPVLTAEIGRLKAIGTPEADLAASVQQSALDELLKSLPALQGNLSKIKSFQSELPALQEQANYWSREQGKLKLEAEDIDKRSLILNQKDALAQARGGVEDRRQAKMALENARLEKEINDIQQNTPEGYDRNEKILNAQRLSKINQENINFDSIAEELAIEKKLLDYDSAIDDKKAGFLSRIGFNFGASKIQRDNAIEQENNRFISDLLELEKSLKDQPDKLAEMKQKAVELNQVNLESIRQQFKDLRTTVEDAGISAIQGFFNQATTNFFDGKAERDRAQLEERLRYAEEVVGLENQYREEPGHLAHLKNRARELNEQNLDKINGQFNIFKRGVDLAKQALQEFIKQLAAMAAQQAAAKVISSVIDFGLNSLGGGKKFDNVKLNKAPKVKAFKADQGWTVGDEIPTYSGGGEIGNRKFTPTVTSWLRNNYPGVASAWKAEGEGAQLGVFHTGEELLSRKTGEAGRYQALKARYGINPLDKILNYSEGGTVGERILAGMSSDRPRIDLSGLSAGGNQTSRVSKTVNLHTTVVTPNADSFRLNQDQRNQDLLETMRRGF